MIQAIIFDCFGVLVGRDGVNQQLLDLVCRLKASGLTVGILSNMAHDEVGQLIGEQSYALFDAVVVSGEIGVGKPDERAFLIAAQHVGEFASDCLLVDDSERNCHAAQTVGMTAVRYTDYNQFYQELAHYGIITP